MKGLDSYLTDNSAQEDDDRAFEQACEALAHELGKCKSDPSDLFDLLMEVMGEKGAAAVIEDFLRGDSDELNEAMIEWNRESN